MSENGTGICEWTSWQTLTEDQKQYELHRVLIMLDARTKGIDKMVKLYASLGGFVGGSITVIAGMGLKFMAGS